MRRLLIALLTAAVLGPAAGALKAAHVQSPDTRSLNKAHKQQRKALEQQQRAVKKAMGGRQVSNEQRRRFNHELKVERQALRQQQKNESRRLEASRKNTAHSHVTVLNSTP